MADHGYMYWTPEGDTLFKSSMKGSNPNKEKHPVIKCPNCGKFMFYVKDKNVKNNTLCFDMDTEQYKDFPRICVRICSKCHHHIGILKLNSLMRKMLDIPQIHECHQKLKIQ